MFLYVFAFNKSSIDPNRKELLTLQDKKREFISKTRETVKEMYDLFSLEIFLDTYAAHP